MAATPMAESEPGLRRVLGTWDLVLFNIAAIIALRWLSVAAQVGPSSLVLWLLGLVCFFLPLALAVLELSSRVPGEGGLYLWSKAAFGDLHGFIVGWTYWVSNLAYFPSMLLFSAGIFLHVGGAHWTAHANDGGYNLVYCLGVLWAATWLSILGLERAKWLQNIGGAATWSAGVLILAGGAIAMYRFGPATHITAHNVWPDFGKLATFTTFATIALAFQGLELGPILGGEIREPERRIPRATLISCGVIAAVYIAGTASLLIALPASTIDVIGGIPQALSAIGDRIGLPVFGPITALLVTMGSIGTIAAWVTGTARLPFVVGVDRYLPPALGQLHPKHDTPHVALITQGVLTSLMLLAALSGSTIHEAYIILIDMTVIMSLLPLSYILLAFPLLRHRAKGRNQGVNLVPLGNVGSWVAGLTGFAVTLLAIATAMIPPADDPHPALFLLKVIGGSGLLIGIGLMFYRQRHRRMQAAQSA
ncbi:APC family permease [Dyella mobilis]|uniref:Amino acid permease n=1 Tax=Dyella mobilis TaxID=1849582 RepID=A0ABS2KF24_9GAMM|nr:APC family permease [Dyella mobilis]MBM7129650.1 amino acid permease [Dyella mobilis]GLQ98085.1 amino acid permease [Dyella mobilis]